VAGNKKVTFFIKYEKHNLTAFEAGVIKPSVLKVNCSHHAVEC